MSEALERIEKNIDQLFDKVNSLATGLATNAAILPRIEESLKCLPCQAHAIKIESVSAKVDKEIYALTKTKDIIFGSIALLTGIVTIAAFFGKIYNWY